MKLAENIKFDPTKLPVTRSNEVEVLQAQMETLFKWAVDMERQVMIQHENTTNLIAGFDGLVGLIIEGKPVTAESLKERVEAFKENVKQMRDEARKRAEAQKSTLWTPPENKIVPGV